MVKFFPHKCIIALNCVILFFSCSKPDYFSGIIEYQYAYESSLLSIDSLTERKPYKSVFRYDTSGYQSVFAGANITSYYYWGKMAKCISQDSMNGMYYCEDYSLATDSIISYNIYETNEKILGQRCRVIEWQGKYFYTLFYVSTETFIAPASFNAHLAYNWKFYGESTGGGLILKTEHRFKNYTMKGVAVNIRKRNKGFKALEIDKKLFDKYCQ